ncbi:MAG: hypothetical protein PHI98_16805 [Eubacteriales bacterium]|nr:hypothetical protein [Eubacteriales bacterium]
MQNTKQIQLKVSTTICHSYFFRCLAALMLLLCLFPLVSIAEYATSSAWAAPIYAASEQWEQEKGEWRLWSYVDKAAFCEQYGAYPCWRTQAVARAMCWILAAGNIEERRSNPYRHGSGAQLSYTL